MTGWLVGWLLCPVQAARSAHMVKGLAARLFPSSAAALYLDIKVRGAAVCRRLFIFPEPRFKSSVCVRACVHACAVPFHVQCKHGAPAQPAPSCAPAYSAVLP